MTMTFQEIRIIATGPCIANQLRDVNTICRRSWYIAAHILKIYDFKIKVVPFIINLVLSWPLSSNTKHKSKNDADEAVYVVSLTSSSVGYINGRNSANLELLIDKTWSIYLYVKLKASHASSYLLQAFEETPTHILSVYILMSFYFPFVRLFGVQ
jgi:hypothetical protein